MASALDRLELLELVRDLFLVLVAELVERERPPLGQRHQAVGALEHALDVFRSAQQAPPSHGARASTRQGASSQHLPPQERLDAVELVDHRLRAKPAVTLALVEMRLDRPSERAQPVGDRARLRGRHDLVRIALQDQQRRRDAIGDVQRRPVAVRVRGVGQRADDRVQVVRLEAVRRLVEVEQVRDAEQVDARRAQVRMMREEVEHGEPAGGAAHGNHPAARSPQPRRAASRIPAAVSDVSRSPHRPAIDCTYARP